MAQTLFIMINCCLVLLFTLVSLSNASPDPTTSFRAIFTVPAEADDGVLLIPNINDPQAVNAQDVCPGYKASNVVRTSVGLTADLALAGDACNLYGTDVDFLSLTVEYQSQDRLHIEITPTFLDGSNSSWFELPEELIPKPIIEAGANVILDSDLVFSYSNDPTFSFTVVRKSTGDTLFSTEGSHIVFENQFIEFGSALPENYNLYGLGEVIHGLRLGNNFTRTIFAADVGDPIDGNIYGSHSFYLDTRYFEVDEASGNLTYAANATDISADYVSQSHGVFLRNSHGQEILLRPSNITWRTIGGNIDLYFYAGPTQKEVTTSYQLSTTGLPTMQKYHALGFHQCRWGYTNWSELQDVVDSFARFGIPLENIWTDIDYMNQFRDFENDQNTFGYSEAAVFLSKIHASGLHYIPIIDSAIYVPNPTNESDAYPTFNRGNASDAFMLNPDGSLYIGEVWPGYTVFPDWVGSALNGTGANEWWANELAMWHSLISFDGIWIDMSEVSSFCIGSCGSDNLTMNPVHPGFLLPGEPGGVVYGFPEGFNITNATEAASASAGAASQAAAASTPVPSGITSTSASFVRTTPTPGVRNINYPPYVINNIQGTGDLSVHAVAPNATHHGGIQEYDVHNLFGHQIINATYHALLNIFPTKRPFIIARSTFAGSGKWAGHWGGDNASNWYYMFFSIPQALTFALFGIPMFGVDTCGFNGNTDEELCNRWMQLSAFFPFYRNHNVLSAVSQEPYRWASVIESTKAAMNIRYQLLPYLYTLLYLSHSTGSTTMRALSWEFPNDPTLANADRQFLLGSSLMVTPVLVQGATTVDGIFPGVGKGEVWYDWYDQTAVNVSAGQNLTIEAPLGHIPVYIRGGSVLPLQGFALTTREARTQPWSLISALSLEGTGSGSLYIDDGESLVPNATLFVEFTVASSTLHASARGLFQDTNPLANISILGVENTVSNVSLNGAAISSGWTYDSTSKVLAITGLQNSTSGGAWAEDWVLTWS